MLLTLEMSNRSIPMCCVYRHFKEVHKPWFFSLNVMTNYDSAKTEFCTRASNCSFKFCFLAKFQKLFAGSDRMINDSFSNLGFVLWPSEDSFSSSQSVENYSQMLAAISSMATNEICFKSFICDWNFKKWLNIYPIIKKFLKRFVFFLMNVYI